MKLSRLSNGKKIILAIIFFSFPVVAADFSSFAMMVPCSIKTSGIGLTGHVTRFPLLVRIGPSIMRNVTRKNDGGDIRFSKSGANKANLTPLPYQKERWYIAGSDSAAEFWVLVDTIYANNNTQMIFLHYGHPSAQDSSRPASVFSAANGFVAVWHLSETGTGQRLDATANNCHLDPSGYTGGEGGPALIGNGDNAGSMGKHLYKNNPSAAQVTGNAITVSCWVGNWDTTLSQAHFITKYNWGAPSTSYKIWGWGRTGIGTVVTSAGEMTGYFNGLVHGAWNHVAMTYDGANLYVYVNGMPSQAYAHTGAIVDCTEPFRFRYQSDGAQLCNPFLGPMDEARLESVARSRDWIRLCYENQRPNSPLVRFGVASGTPPEQGSISAAPADTTVLVGATVTFRATCTAIGPSYAWYKVKAGGDSLMNVTTPTLTLTNVQKAMNGSQFYCKGTSSSGRWTGNSNYVTLRVVQKVEASISAAPLMGQDSVRVTFTDNSTGDITNWQWSFGDNTTDESVTKRPTVVHTYRGAGTYVCRLIVSGQGIAGRDTAYSDTIRVYGKAGNPLTISATYVSGTRISIKIGNIKAVNTAPIPPPFASEIGLWFVQSGDIDTSVSKVFRKWTIGAADSIREILTVPPPSNSTHGVYRFWVCPLWNTGVNAYSSLNGADVIMRPVNRFILSGKYLGNRAMLPNIDLDLSALDSALVTVTNPDVIDTPSVTKVVFSWGLSPTRMIQSDTIAAKMFKGWWSIRSPLFEGDTQRVYVRAEQVSANGLVSLPVDTFFLVGWPKPIYKGSMVVDTVGPTYAVVRWDAPGEGVDSIRVIYCQSPDTIPIGTVPATEVGTRYSAAYAPNAQATSLRIVGLKMETTYWLGLQIRQNSQWSNIGAATRVLITTKPVDPTSIVPNTATIDSVWYDSLFNAFVVKWRLDLIPMITLDLGITFATDEVKATTVTPDDAAKSSKILLGVNSTSGETRVALGDSIRFNTLYWIALWVRSSVGPWAAPTAGSTDTCRSGGPLWQVVKYFERGIDTVRAFNGQVLISNDGSYPTIVAPITDTVKVFKPPAASLKGFVPVSLGVTFQNAPYDSVVLGLKYGVIDYPLSISDLGLYRDSGGVWLTVHDFTHDEKNGIVWHKTKLLTDIMGKSIAYILLLDTVRPSVVIAPSDTGDTARFGFSLSDTVTLSDNVRNLSWRLLFARGGDPYVTDTIYSLAGVACGSCPGGEKVVLNIPSRSITDAVGVRAILIVSDGPHRDTINLSRRIIRENSDAIITEEQKWTPLWVTAHLDSPRVMDALAEMAEYTGGRWKYDKTLFRLFRWVPTGSKPASSNDHWCEYSPANDSFFTFEPGRVIWIKTRMPVSLDFGRAVTVSTKEPYSLHLRARQFTDIALPFAMNIRIGDILVASGRDADSVDIYRWMRDTVTIDGKAVEVRYSELVFSRLGNDPQLQRTSEIIESRPLEAYTIMNRAHKEVVLRIPPLPASMSVFKDGIARQQAVLMDEMDEWCVKIMARTARGYPLTTVYCAVRQHHRGKTEFLPLAPSFYPVTMGVYDRASGEMWGRAISSLEEAEGASWELVFSNESENTEVVRFQIGKCLSAPAHFRVALVGKHKDNGTDTSTLYHEVTIAPRSRELRQIAVGTETYLRSLNAVCSDARPTIKSLSFSSATGIVTARFWLPTNIDAVEVRFRLLTMQGRKVWEVKQREGLSIGNNRISFSPPSVRTGGKAGVYILKMEILSYAGRRLAVAQKITTYVR